jgi:hypothetical protein
MRIEYGQWERGMLPVQVDGVFAGYLSEDADGWIFWKAVPNMNNCFEMHTVAATRKQAVTDSLQQVVLPDD